MTKKGYGQRIKEIRGKVTQEELGKILNKSEGSICAYEQENTEPNIDALIKISEYGKTSIDWILKGDDSLFLKNDKEREFLRNYREAEEKGVAREIETYIDFILDKSKKGKGRAKK